MGKTTNRNVTVVLEAEVARWARLAAAERDTSVSAFLGSLLKERMLTERNYQTARSPPRKALAFEVDRAPALPRRAPRAAMRYFVDTNVLVYRRHAEAGPKQVRAATIVERLWRKGDGRTSVMNPFALASSDLP